MKDAIRHRLQDEGRNGKNGYVRLDLRQFIERDEWKGIRLNNTHRSKKNWENPKEQGKRITTKRNDNDFGIGKANTN